ncbi:ethanolamine utilization protein EutJ [Cellulosilyticum sp. I15G10I2]|uniref:ethanolamine utilization protein EutJ n=1 Tax=Cellulosilyticum sp. I15G10I2 TaxID=1892843 RepID=UPI00085CC63B|nr:ethanolamine utilization protein EutJ [Cellulosilyticum sp. I15G10I2]
MYDAHRVKALIDKVEETLTTTYYVKGKQLKVGVDLGTAYIVMVVLDEDNKPVAAELRFASVLRDGVVVDYTGALTIVKELKAKLEKRLGVELIHAAIAMPPGTESSTRTHSYVVEGAGMEVTYVLDEPTAANNVLNIRDGVVVDIGGGTTGLAIFEDSKVTYVADEPTGGTHLSLVLAGNYKISLEEAEKIKTDSKRHREILPVVKPVVEKMAQIVKTHTKGYTIDTIYMCGGTCCLSGIEGVFEKAAGLTTVKPENPFLVTPTGIAMSCIPFMPVSLYQ